MMLKRRLIATGLIVSGICSAGIQAGAAEFPEQPFNEKLPVIELAVPAPSDATARRTRFEQRSSEAELAKLCDELKQALKPELPGLEEFYRLAEAGKHQEALDTYKMYFFAKLADPEKFGGAREGAFNDNTLLWGWGKGQPKTLLQTPYPALLAHNLAGRAVFQSDAATFIGHVGAPGAVNWNPADLAPPAGADPWLEVDIAKSEEWLKLRRDLAPIFTHPFWKTPGGESLRQRVDFHRALNRYAPLMGTDLKWNGFFNALLGSYATTGHAAHLRLWCDYLDDWSLNAIADMEKKDHGVRSRVMEDAKELRHLLLQLRAVQAARPTLVADFSAPALVRFLLTACGDIQARGVRGPKSGIGCAPVIGHVLSPSVWLHEFMASDAFGTMNTLGTGWAPPAKVTEITVLPAADAKERAARFAARTTDAELDNLVNELRRAMQTGLPGLEEFDRLAAAGKSREALEAYRDFFFAKLANPERFGIHPAALNAPNLVYWGGGKQYLIKTPHPEVLAAARSGQMLIPQPGSALRGDIGRPGTVNWAPATLTAPDGLDPVALRGTEYIGTDRKTDRTPASLQVRRHLEFYRGLHAGFTRPENVSPGFDALLMSYATGGPVADLQLWTDYLDDWCMNSLDDRWNRQLDVRQAIELETQAMQWNLVQMRTILLDRPDFAADFPAATLARYLLVLVRDFAPYMIRSTRSEIANWGEIAKSGAIATAEILPEFKAMEYVRREAWRIFLAKSVQWHTLDGENIEAGDAGHSRVASSSADAFFNYLRLPQEADAKAQRVFSDWLASTLRTVNAARVTQAAGFLPDWMHPGQSTWMVRNYNIYPHVFYNQLQGGFYGIDAEPEARARLDYIAGDWTKPGPCGLPVATSDFAPYRSVYRLRSSWQRDGEMLLMHNARVSSQGGFGFRTQVDLARVGQILTQLQPLAVDRRFPNPFYGLPRTGGKTDFSVMAGRNVVKTRFHASDAFDLAEARQDSPYASFRGSGGMNRYGVAALNEGADDPGAIREVTALRQVFSIRGEGLYLVNDRIESEKPDATHEYTQFLTLPIRLGRPNDVASWRQGLEANAGKVLILEDEPNQRLATDNPIGDNLSIKIFAPKPLTFANQLDSKGVHEKLAKHQTEIFRDVLDKNPNYQFGRGWGGDFPALQSLPILRPVSARWTGTGNQQLVSLLYIRPKQANEDLRLSENLSGPGDATGCRIVTRTGTEVWLMSGPALENALTCGPVTATAETLLVVKKEGSNELTGMILGGKTLVVNGKTVDLPRPDCEFSIADPANPVLAETPVYRPIDTVKVSPEQNVITDKVTVSFDIPTQKTGDIVFRYTVDGSNPTLESTLYTGPFTLTESTLVKVRPFRKGLKTTPWPLPGVEAGLVVPAIFRKQETLQSKKTGNLVSRLLGRADDGEPGLKYEYFEGDWPTLFTYVGIPGVLTPKTTGTVKGLLDPDETKAIRQTDGAYAIRYTGVITVPATGIYSIPAPVHLYTPTMDAGYDLRVFIGGKEWYPSPTLHSENIWHVPLEKGDHDFMVAYTDYRTKPFRSEYLMVWQPEQMWQGTPVLEISGPGVKKQPIPAAWLTHGSR